MANEDVGETAVEARSDDREAVLRTDRQSRDHQEAILSAFEEENWAVHIDDSSQPAGTAAQFPRRRHQPRRALGTAQGIRAQFLGRALAAQWPCPARETRRRRSNPRKIFRHVMRFGGKVAFRQWAYSRCSRVRPMRLQFVGRVRVGGNSHTRPNPGCRYLWDFGLHTR